MSENLDIDLSPPSAVSASGESASVDLGPRRRAALVPVRCEGFAGTGSFQVFLETSQDGATNWTPLDVARVELGVPEVRLSSFETARFVRLRWQLEGTATVELAAAGIGCVLYATPKQLPSFGAPGRSFEEVTAYEQIEACLAASDEADGYIGNAYRLPLSRWGFDLVKHVAALAVEIIFAARGIDPDGPDAVIIDRRNRAVQWLDRLGQGRISPPGMVDSTPEEFEGVCVVTSLPRRDTWR